MGITAFGGPPVHFQIVRVQHLQYSSRQSFTDKPEFQFYKKFVEQEKWIDEQTVCQEEL